MYSYRDPLFEIRQIGMSMVYSVFVSECCNKNVLWMILSTHFFCSIIYVNLTLFLFCYRLCDIKSKQWKVTNVVLVLSFLLFTLPGKRNIATSYLKRQTYEAIWCFFNRTIDVLSEDAKNGIRIFLRTRTESFTKFWKRSAYLMYEHKILSRRSPKQKIYILVE